eukprot:5996854-Pleurochrysis_carterae.AAC.1
MTQCPRQFHRHTHSQHDCPCLQAVALSQRPCRRHVWQQLRWVDMHGRSLQRVEHAPPAPAE